MSDDVDSNETLIRKNTTGMDESSKSCPHLSADSSEAHSFEAVANSLKTKYSLFLSTHPVQPESLESIPLKWSHSGDFQKYTSQSQEKCSQFRKSPHSVIKGKKKPPTRSFLQVCSFEVVFQLNTISYQNIRMAFLIMYSPVSIRLNPKKLSPSSKPTQPTEFLRVTPICPV